MRNKNTQIHRGCQVGTFQRLDSHSWGLSDAVCRHPAAQCWIHFYTKRVWGVILFVSTFTSGGAVRTLYKEAQSPFLSHFSASLLTAELSLFYSCWIIQKCFDSQYDCESGAAALSCTVTIFSLSIFSCALISCKHPGVIVQKKKKKKKDIFSLKFSPGCWGRGGFFRGWIIQMLWPPFSRKTCVIPLNLYSGQVSFHWGAEKRREGSFLSHHAPAVGPKLAQWDGRALLG